MGLGVTDDFPSLFFVSIIINWSEKLLKSLPRLLLQKHCVIHDSVLGTWLPGLSWTSLTRPLFSIRFSTISLDKSHMNHGRLRFIMSFSLCSPLLLLGYLISLYPQDFWTDTLSSIFLARRTNSSRKHLSGFGLPMRFIIVWWVWYNPLQVVVLTLWISSCTASRLFCSGVTSNCPMVWTRAIGSGEPPSTLLSS